jgi:hypothetical protein
MQVIAVLHGKRDLKEVWKRECRGDKGAILYALVKGWLDE